MSKGNLTEKDKAPKKSTGIGAKYWILLFILVFIVFLITPLPAYLISKVPEKLWAPILSSLYQNISLIDKPVLMKDPIKFSHKEPFPVLSHDTGLCFSFASTRAKENESAISASQIAKAKTNTPIAEVIATAVNKEYKLDYVTVDEESDPHKNAVTLICHKFPKRYSVLPEEVDAVYVRPLFTFTPFKIDWASADDFSELIPYQNRYKVETLP